MRTGLIKKILLAQMENTSARNFQIELVQTSVLDVTLKLVVEYSNLRLVWRNRQIHSNF